MVVCIKREISNIHVCVIEKGNESFFSFILLHALRLECASGGYPLRRTLLRVFAAGVAVPAGLGAAAAVAAAAAVGGGT